MGNSSPVLHLYTQHNETQGKVRAMFRRVPMIETIYRTATAASTYVIQGPTYAAGQVLVIDLVGTCNEDDNNRDISVGVRIGTKDVWLHTIQGLAKGQYYSIRLHMTVRSENRLIFKVHSPQVGNRTLINVIGYFLESE
jgi:hypothetical protein